MKFCCEKEVFCGQKSDRTISRGPRLLEHIRLVTRQIALRCDWDSLQNS